MTLPLWIIAIITVAEVCLLLLVLLFFIRLKRSEDLLERLQANQEQVLRRIYANAELEQELVGSFTERQHQLATLNARLEERAATLQRLLEQAEGIARSPQFLREVILNSRKKGHTAAQIARSTGLSVDEVELILAGN